MAPALPYRQVCSFLYLTLTSLKHAEVAGIQENEPLRDCHYTFEQMRDLAYLNESNDSCAYLW